MVLGSKEDERVGLRRLIVFIATIVSIVATGCASAVEPHAAVPVSARSTPLPPVLVEQMVSSADIRLGQDVFSQNCTACHGVTGRGDGTSVRSGAISGVPDFTNSATLTTTDAATMYQVITDGRLENFMPPWGRVLSEAERWAVAVYVYSLR